MPLGAGGTQKDGDRPLAKRNLGLFQGRAGANTEILTAPCTVIGHGVLIGHGVGLGASAPRAGTLIVRPSLFLKPPAGGCLVREHVAEFKQ